MVKCVQNLVLLGIVLFIASFLSLQVVHGQEFPTKPVTLIVPVGAGGSHDLTARALSSVAAEYLGKPLIVQLKPGGSGAIGSDYVGNAAPDGYTLLLGGPQWSSTIPAVEGKSKGPEDLAAVSRINYSPMVVGVRSGMPFKNLKEMLEWCKANPGKLIAGSSGVWSKTDIFWKQMQKQIGISVKVVPYDGGGPALMALMGAHADTTCGLTSSFLPYIKAGKMFAAATLDNKRDKALPDVPTSIEQGINATHLMWRGVLAPKATPRPIIDKLATAFKKMTEDKSFISIIDRLGDDVQYLGPDEFTKVWRTEFEVDKELGKIYKK